MELPGTEIEIEFNDSNLDHTPSILKPSDHDQPLVPVEKHRRSRLRRVADSLLQPLRRSPRLQKPPRVMFIDQFTHFHSPNKANLEVMCY